MSSLIRVDVNPVSFALSAGENLFSGNHGEGATFTSGGDAWIVGGTLTATQTLEAQQVKPEC